MESVMDGAEKVTLSTVWYGDCRNSTTELPTDRLFTGQRYDDTGLYYYGARYYDPEIGRFISPDTFVQKENDTGTVSNDLTVNQIPRGLGDVNPSFNTYPFTVQDVPLDPQSLNRYSYVTNNPLKFTDPYGWWTFGFGFNINIGIGKGFSFSWMVVFDGHGNVGTATSKADGELYVDTASAGIQLQWSRDADSITQLGGKSQVIGSSATVGPLTVPTLGTLNAGYSGGADFIVGEDYVASNSYFGVGASIFPVETHHFKEETQITIWHQGSKADSHSTEAERVTPIEPEYPYEYYEFLYGVW